MNSTFLFCSSTWILHFFFFFLLHNYVSFYSFLFFPWFTLSWKRYLTSMSMWISTAAAEFSWLWLWLRWFWSCIVYLWNVDVRICSRSFFFFFSLCEVVYPVFRSVLMIHNDTMVDNSWLLSKIRHPYFLAFLSLCTLQLTF